VLDAPFDERQTISVGQIKKIVPPEPGQCHSDEEQLIHQNVVLGLPRIRPSRD